MLPMVHVSAPGKLMISGEWSVLEGNPCVVAAVNKRVHSIVEASEGDYISVSLDDFNLHGIKFSWNGTTAVPSVQANADKLKFTKESIEVALRFLAEKGIDFRPFSLRTYGEDTNIGGKKVGFGSSASAVVAITDSILRFYGYKPKKEEVYKLAAIAHYFAQGKAGSAFDIAASTYGGLLIYRRFDAQWLTEKMESREKISDIVKDKWPGFVAKELEIPDFNFAIAWTKESASTSAMMKQMDSFKKSNPGKYIEIYDNICHVTETLVDAFESSNEEKMLKSVSENSRLLHQLTKESGVNIETPELKQLAEIAEKYGAAGKLSGAGGGDCGFAISFSRETIEKVKKAWQEAGLQVIDADIDKYGVMAD